VEDEAITSDIKRVQPVDLEKKQLYVDIHGKQKKLVVNVALSNFRSVMLHEHYDPQ
jgi:hypothetical protein